MKDLRDYYKSPPKPETVVKCEVRDADNKLASTQNGPENQRSRKSDRVDEKKIAKKSDTSARIISDSKNASTTTVKAADIKDNQPQLTKGNKENTKSASKNYKKRGRKSKVSRKPSDPAVKNITDLLNASLNIISPNTSLKVDRRDFSTFEDIEKSKPLRSVKKKSRQSSPHIHTANGSKKRQSLTNVCEDKVGENKDSHKTCSDAEKQSKKEPRRSSSDFETPKRSKKSISDKSTSHKNNVDSHKKSLENVSCDSVLENKTPVESKSSSNVPSRSSKTTEKNLTSKGDKIRDHNVTTSNKSVKKVVSKSTNETVDNELGDKIITIDCTEEPNSTRDSDLDESQGTSKPKVNAFQFMMESRFKSIGQNLTGKEVSDEPNTQEEIDKKQKHLSRKRMLENWAESKGEAKRKRKKEEDKDIYINHQLEKRAKRLKKLLNVSNNTRENISESCEESPRKSSRKRIIKPVIDSDLDSSGDVSNENNKVKDDKVSSNIVNKLSSFVDSPLNTNITNMSNTNKESLHQNGLLNFLGITNKLKSEEIEKQELKKESSKENKKSWKKLKKEQSKLGLTKTNTAFEENANVDLDCVNQPTSDVCILNTESHDIIDELSLNDNTVGCHSAVYSCERSCSQDSIRSMRKGFQTPNTKKHKKSENIEDHLLGRSPRSWKMRIRLASDDEGTSTNESTISKLAQKNDNEQGEGLEEKNSIIIDDEGKSEKRGRPKRKVREKNMEILLSSDSEDEVDIVTRKKKPERSQKLKVAPVFLKAAPKPKLDPKVAEARREFLMSGVPDQLKRDIEKQVSVEEMEFDVFPVISHVQQRCNRDFWTLSPPDLKLTSPSRLQEDGKNMICRGLTLKNADATPSLYKSFQKVEICKQLIKKIKSKNVSYPVYKSFKSIYDKSGLKNKKEHDVKPTTSPKKKTPQKKKGKKSKKKDLDDSVEIIETSKENTPTLTDCTMWTEKYKPICSSDIIGNTNSVLQLKKWLERWIDPVEDSRKRNKRKRNCSTSESEFEYMDSDSRESTSEVRNTVLLKGPCGSGKSSAVYAICNELGMNVLELNASSKRTGKRLLQELQEATQSHQVMKGESATLSQYIKLEKSKDKQSTNSQNSERNKICVLLVEDVDIIFEQDEGFLSALTQLINTSKRPIIVTTTDDTSQISCRFTSLYSVIDFKPLSVQSSGIWLQILCLVEGVSLDLRTIGHMLEKNRGDIRKTMLELQYWVQTRGNLCEDKNNAISSLSTTTNAESHSDEKLCDDDNSNLSFINENPDCQDILDQAGCLESFEGNSYGNNHNMPYKITASKIWWNLPDILSLKSFRLDAVPEDYLNNQQVSADERNPNLQEDKKIEKLKNRKKLRAICDIYESLVLIDVAKGRRECLIDLEPCPRQWDNALKDSLELTENFVNYSSNDDLTEDICHSLVDGYMENYRKFHKHSNPINLGVPSISTKRWREKQHLCEDILQDTLSFSNYVERRAVSVDCLPILRQIGRSEAARASQNVKRGNRFNHYLKGLGVDGGDSSYKIICNVLNVDNFKSSCS